MPLIKVRARGVYARKKSTDSTTPSSIPNEKIVIEK